jgi:tRNA nucleotidyltransferase/poly(A) polymerase
MQRRASMHELSADLAAAARTIAARVATTGHRAWIVGGAVRDLCLARAPHEIDMASAATPEDIRRIFEHTIPVGLEFGTVIIRTGAIDVQHTTFRSERGFSDARHPDEVQFGASVEADASRRDFTCNALYLDPLDDTFVDPVRGLDDLRARVLACVGDPRARFEEDGLRLLRMARFAAGLELVPRPDVLAAARASQEALRGVSVERVLVELGRMFALQGAAVAIGILHETGLLERCLVGIGALVPGDVERSTWLAERVALVHQLPSAPGLALGLAALTGPAPSDLRRGASPESRAASTAVIEQLRPSRLLRRSIVDTWEVSERLMRLARESSRSVRIRLMRHDGFEHGHALASAWIRLERGSTSALDALKAERDRASASDLSPAPLIGSADLAALALPRGSAWGEILSEAEGLQLDGELTTRDGALAWLAQRVRRTLHDGGKTPRSPRDSG